MSSTDTTPVERMDAIWHAYKAKTLGLGDAVDQLAKAAHTTHGGAQIMLGDYRPPSVQYALSMRGSDAR